MPSEQPVITLPPVSRTEKTPLMAAWFLAKGSFETAKDHGVRLEMVDQDMSLEMKHLALNFLRIAELLEEAGFKP